MHKIFTSITLSLITATATLQSVEETEKLLFLKEHPKVTSFVATHKNLARHVNNATTEEKIAILSTIAIGQGNNLFHGLDNTPKSLTSLRKLVKILVDTEHFYKNIGGIIGYHNTVLSLMETEEQPSTANFYQPKGISLTKPSEEINYAVKQYIQNMHLFGEMYPIGGAGDRLNLIDEQTGEALPAALLPFTGHTLLTGMIRDLQSREFLYHRLTGKQLITPVALMTSQAKNNHQHILDICENTSWFGRPKDSFRLFTQIQVPVISVNGDWIMKGPLELTVKPGGHGVIWQTAKDEGIFDWLRKHNCTTLLLRQVNNPIANTNYGLLAFLGFGIDRNKLFGFASCQRTVGSAMGMNVLRENHEDGNYKYCISNIEYTEFNKLGIEDTTDEEGGLYSSFPGNTNILFADIDTIESSIKKCPIPGMIINLKSSFPRYKEDCTYETIKGGRLESTMQNIADCITDDLPERIAPSQAIDLKTYLTFNQMRYTHSVTKKAYQPGGPIVDTPLGGYYDLQKNMFDLFTEYCQICLPDIPEETEYVENGPSSHILLHPAIGPLWSVIGQKIRNGKIEYGSELQLDIAEVDIENLQLDGSLIVRATHPLGGSDEEGKVTYGYDNGKCSLINVTIKNAGIDRSTDNIHWKNEIKRTEALEIILHGDAEFYAENMTITGSCKIEVPAGYKVVAEKSGNMLTFRKIPITNPSWYWSYEFDTSNQLILKRIDRHF